MIPESCWKFYSFFFTLPETNIAMENPPFWWYLPGTMGIFMGNWCFSMWLFGEKRRHKKTQPGLVEPCMRNQPTRRNPHCNGAQHGWKVYGTAADLRGRHHGTDGFHGWKKKRIESKNIGLWEISRKRWYPWRQFASCDRKCLPCFCLIQVRSVF